MELIAEAHVFAEKTGLGNDVLEKLIEANFGALAHSDSQRMTAGVYKPAKGTMRMAKGSLYGLVLGLTIYRRISTIRLEPGAKGRGSWRKVRRRRWSQAGSW
jgi:hypothetical protein